MFLEPVWPGPHKLQMKRESARRATGTVLTRAHPSTRHFGPGHKTREGHAFQKPPLALPPGCGSSRPAFIPMGMYTKTPTGIAAWVWESWGASPPIHCARDRRGGRVCPRENGPRCLPSAISPSELVEGLTNVHYYY